jgi:hypothetical protein
VKRHQRRFALKYKNGQRMRAGDIVLVDGNRRAVVEAVLRPRSKCARDYYVEQEGGVLLRFEDGSVEVWVLQPWWNVADEIEFLARG